VISSGGIGSRSTSVALSAALVLIVLVGAALLIWLDRVSTLREAHLTALRLVQVLGEQTQRTVQTVDLMLTAVGEELRAAPDLPEHDSDFENRMRGLLQASPFIRALFVIGPDGSSPRTPIILSPRG
jgi:two-component system, NtrC family, sensor kinase